MPQYTHDVECPRLLPYQVPRKTDPRPTLLEIVPSSSPFTRVSLPRLHIPQSTLLRGLTLTQRSRLMRNRKNILALVPFGAGGMFFYTFPDANRMAARFISTLGLQTNDSLYFEMPMADEHAWDDSFAPPYAIFLHNTNLDLRRFLVWHQTFDVDATFAFHAMELKEHGPGDWAVVTLALTGTSTYLCGKPNASRAQEEVAIHARIGRELSTNEFKRVNGTLLRKYGMTGSDDELLRTARREIQVDYITPDPEINPGYHSYVVWTAPIAEDMATDDKEKWIASLRRAVKESGVYRHLGLRVAPENECFWCKSPTHATVECPFTSTPGWKGPSSVNVPAWINPHPMAGDANFDHNDPVGYYYNNL